MASKFTPINENDTKELRKDLDLPITKTLYYMLKTKDGYKRKKVKDYRIVETYLPSGTPSLQVTYTGGKVIRILAPFFHICRNQHLLKI
jgi:hypothetical protein